MTFSGFMKRVLAGDGPGAGLDVEAWLALAGSRNGYERQAAVEALGRLRHGPALPVLLRRANDWVPQVRAAATQALRGLLEDDCAGHWLRALDEIVALQRARRSDHGGLLQDIAYFLARPAHLPRLAEAASRASGAVRRYAWALQWRHAEDDRARMALLRAAVTGTDLVLARQALAHVEPAVPPAQARALIDAACCARLPAIRAEGLRRALAAPRADTPSLLRCMCLDDHALVRSIAWRALQAQGAAAEAVALATARLARTDLHDSAKVPALQLLCMADAAVARVHCEALRASPSTALRRAAWAWWLAAAPQGTDEAALLAALADPAAPVQRLAVQAVRRGAPVPAATAVLQVGLAHGSAGGLARALAMLRPVAPWSRLHGLLQAWTQAATPAQQAACEAALVQWEIDLHRSFVAPTAEEQAAVQAPWRQVSGSLPTRLAHRVEAHLKAYGVD